VIVFLGRVGGEEGKETRKERQYPKEKIKQNQHMNPT
jgi:hypothetical protein